MEKNKAFIIRGNNVIGMDVQRVFSTCPLGTVLSFAGQTAPRSFLLCDGQSYAVAEYPDLYAVIGNTYGGDDANFNVPNLVDKFIQGSTASGTEKEAGLPNIAGEAWIRVREGSSTADSIEQTTGAFTRGSSHTLKRATAVADESATKSLKIDASLSNPIYGNSDTVQPPALTMVYIIKAFHTNEGMDSGLDDETIELINQEIDSKVPSIDIQEVEGGHSVTITDKNGEETFNVLDGKDGVQIDDSVTNTTSVWSSSKTKNYIDTAGKTVTILASGKSSDTGWNLKRGTQYDFGRLLLINAYNDTYSGTTGTGSELLLIMGDYETAKVTSVVVAKTGIAINRFYSLETSSSGTLIIKTTSDLAISNTGKGKARLSFTFLN